MGFFRGARYTAEALRAMGHDLEAELQQLPTPSC